MKFINLLFRQVSAQGHQQTIYISRGRDIQTLEDKHFHVNENRPDLKFDNEKFVSLKTSRFENFINYIFLLGDAVKTENKSVFLFLFLPLSLSLSLYIYIYIYMMHARAHKPTHTHIHTHTHIYIYIYIYI